MVVETGFPEFTTFSVGEGVDRRTVVCFQQQLLDFTLGNHAFQKAGVEEGLVVSSKLGEFGDETTACSVEVVEEFRDFNSSKDPSTKDIRPDLTILSAGKEVSEKNGVVDSFDEQSAKEEMVQSREEIFKDCEDELLSYIPQPTEEDHTKTPAGTPSKTAPVRCRGRSKRPDIPVYVPPRGRGKQLPCQEEYVVHSPNNAQTALENALKLSADDAELTLIDSSDAESSDANDATEQVVDEITSAVGGVQIEAPIVDYAAFKTSDTTINIDQFGHVIELYDFPQHLKTNDLMAAFHAFTSRWDIKWVDDTHALGVFSSAEVAAEALVMRHPHIKSRPLNMATAQSKCKARAVCEFLLPYKQRPATSTGPARRLLQWALGSDKKVPAASKAEQDRLREAIKRKEEERRKKREEEREERKNKFSEHDHR